MRTKGSCQFHPYYKVERYDDKIMAWTPIQKVFRSIDDAKTCCYEDKSEKRRVMRFTEKGVEIYPS